MKPAILFLGVTVALAGCAEPVAWSPPAPPRHRRGPGFDLGAQERHQHRDRAGLHRCRGQASHLCRPGGSPIPDSAYARARMTAIFGSTTKGMRAASVGPAGSSATTRSMSRPCARPRATWAGQSWISARALWRLVRHEQRQVAGRRAGRGRLAHWQRVDVHGGKGAEGRAALSATASRQSAARSRRGDLR